MFEINGSHIAQLNDADLRTLVARLCEAELRRAGLPVSAVTAGGNQDAADGGLDVRVELPESTIMNGHVLRPNTGFQVKVPDMPPAEITSEMRPTGALRPIIRELAAASGAYIIVSANGSLADAALQRRRKAMRKAVARVRNGKALTLDFYDRERMASWVREHPGMVIWVRERIGQQIPGWQPYASWANPSEGTDAEYIADKESRILDPQTHGDIHLPLQEGVRRLRLALAKQKGVVRLIGLSGMGKTRLVQALFDVRIGEQALDPTLAVYTDLANEPVPTPRELMHRLIQSRQRAIFVVDNCPPASHRALAAMCTATESMLSLITIEFDIRDDDPEGTEVFRLEQSSKEVIEGLLAHQAPHISKVNRERIAELSGGNFRVALALAHTLRRGESVGNLTDQDLFDRLFRQRNQHDEGLLQAAEACSLVYSFHGELREGESAELPLLADLAGLSFDQLLRHVGELRARGLVQHRGPWRAVLPQAIAIRLAHQALGRVVPDRILSNLVERAPERVARSFSRRLGQLHGSEVARWVVHGWLSAGGLLSDLTGLSQLQAEMVRNVAPVDPEATLAAIECAANGGNGVDFLGSRNYQRHIWMLLLKSIAYDEALFQRAALLLLQFALAEVERGHGSARDLFLNLFHLYLSGTKASIEQRVVLVGGLVASENEAIQALGLDALKEMMKTTFFTMAHASEFGARPRDYGLHPATASDVVSWYRTAIEFAKGLALTMGPLCDRGRQIIGENFRELWKVPGIADELEGVARSIGARRFWPEGWVAVRGIIRSQVDKLPPEVLSRLQALELDLRPRDLVERARAYVFSREGSWRDIADVEGDDDNPASGYHRVEQIAEELGREVARDSHTWRILLPDLVSGKLSCGWHFGVGLGNSTPSLAATWASLVDAYATTPAAVRNDLVLRGFMSVAAERDKMEATAILNAAIDSPELGPIYPALQAVFPIDDSDAARIIGAIRRGLAPIYGYRFLARGPALETISLCSLQGVIRELTSQPDGFPVAVEVFFRFLEERHIKGQPVGEDIALSGRDLLRSITFGSADNQLDFQLTGIAAACLAGEDAVECAATICRRLHSALRDSSASLHNYDSFTASVFMIQPRAALDEFVGNQVPDAGTDPVTVFEYSSKNPVEMVPIDALLAWAQISPTARFPRLAAAIDPFAKNENGEDPALKPVASQLLAQAPNRRAILDRFGFCEWPKGAFSRPLTAIFEGRRNLARTFLSDENPEVRAWAQAIDADLGQIIEHERLREQPGSGSFE